MSGSTLLPEATAARGAVVGHVEWVTFMRVDRVPLPGEIVHAHEWWEEPGGGGAGAAAQMAKLGGGADFFTAVGDDDIGRRAQDALSDQGVRVHAAIRPEPTRRAVTFIDSSGERTITVVGRRLAPGGDDPLPWDELGSVGGVYFTAGDHAALNRARSARALVSTARILDLLKSARVPLDGLVGSAHDPAEAYVTGELEPEPRVVVRTDGEHGGTISVAGGAPTRYQPAVSPGPVVDRYGAGDSFAAGFAFGLGAGLDPAAAVALGARCGAAVVTGRGPYEAQLRLASARG